MEGGERGEAVERNHGRALRWVRVRGKRNAWEAQRRGNETCIAKRHRDNGDAQQDAGGQTGRAQPAAHRRVDPDLAGAHADGDFPEAFGSILPTPATRAHGRLSKQAHTRHLQEGKEQRAAHMVAVF